MSRDMTIQDLLRSLTPQIHQKQAASDPTPLSLAATEASAIAEPKTAVQKRCGSSCCKKKLMFADLECSKCKTRFCGEHRLPEAHTCPHDFRKEGQMLLAKQNPRVVHDKIDHI
jgi:predicted nucleic acid binding AN1-type Zn finger protein